MGYSQSSSSVFEILQARILEWVAISFSRGNQDQRPGIELKSPALQQILYHLCCQGSLPINYTPRKILGYVNYISIKPLGQHIHPNYSTRKGNAIGSPIMMTIFLKNLITHEIKGGKFFI